MNKTETKQMKTVFEVNGVKYAVVRPNAKVQAECDRVENQAFKKAVDVDGCLVREKINDILTRQGLWDDEKKAKVEGIQADIMETEKKRAKGGIKLSEARDLAMKIRRLRRELQEVLAVRTRMDSMTAEAQAQNARFNHCVASCIVNNDTGAKHYKNVDDYVEHMDSEIAFQGATILAKMLAGGSGYDVDWQKKLPENQFLLKYGFMNDKMQLIDKQGKLVDEDGRLIDEEGFYIGEDGKRVNKNGDRVDEFGHPVFDDAKPYLDEDGQPVEAEKPNKVELLITGGTLGDPAN